MKLWNNMGVQHRLLVTGATFIALGLMGIFFGFLGTSLPSIRAFLKIDLEEAGLLTSVLQLGFAATNMVGGILSDYIRRDKVLMSGCLFLGFSAFLLGQWPIFSLNLLILTCMGVGCGLIQSSSNPLLIGLYPERKGNIINLLHVFFAVGSLIGPLVMGYLISYQLKWQWGYGGLGFLFLFLFIIFILTEIPKMEARGKVKLDQIGHLLREKDFILLVWVNFFAIGTQFAIMFLSVTFLREAKGFSILISSITLSAFFISLAIGRLACSWLSTRIPNSTVILGMLFFLLTIIIVAWEGEGWISVIALVLSGLACSGIFPSLLALTGTLFYEVTGTALGISAMMAGLGGMFVCWFTALISQRTSVAFGFVVLIVSSLTAFILFFSHYQSFLKNENTRQVFSGGKSS